MSTSSASLDHQAPDATSTHRTSSLGQYRLIARLGTGGMAEVFLAVAQGAMDVNRLVVVKRLRDEQADDEAARVMFLNEARLAARLSHPNVIQTFDAGVESGSYFLAMEYVDGQPLSRLLGALRRAGRRMDPKVAARICAGALHGLHYAHELTDFDGTPLQIVHRDVSPQNIMVTYDGVTKIVDFGIAKAAGTAQTEHGVFKGKIAFMAPEQMLGGALDARVDVFATGIVLWEALTGKHLIADDTPAKTLHNLMYKPIPRASEVCPDVPAALDDLLAKALERDVTKRWASAREMRDALEAFLASSGGATEEDVGALVTSFFAEMRAKVQKEVKAQIAALSLTRRSDPALSGSSVQSGLHMRPASATLIDLSDGALLRTASTANGTFRLVTSAGPLLPRPTPMRRLAFAVWITVTLGALFVTGLTLHRTMRSDPTRVPAAPAATTAIPQVPRELAAAAPPAPAPLESAAPSPTPSHAVAAPAPTVTSMTPAQHTWRPTPAPRPSPATGAATPSSAAVAAPEPARAHVAHSPTKPAEVPTGRTFRRDL